jgi:hypothetical protein
MVTFYYIIFFRFFQQINFNSEKNVKKSVKKKFIKFSKYFQQFYDTLQQKVSIVIIYEYIKK